MKMMKKFFALVLALSLAATMCVTTSFAAGEAMPEHNTTYTVTLYAGTKGTLTGSAMPGGSGNAEALTISGLQYGDVVTFNANGAVGSTSEDGTEYYPAYVHQSGNTDKVAAYTVTKDATFVVAYAVKGGNMVPYTVRYVDENGNQLLPDETYYASLDNKVVVSYQYVEGYQPQAYSLGKTLTSDASDNVLTFVYHIPTNTVNEVTNTTEQITQVPVVNPPQGGDNQPGNQPGDNQQGDNQPGGEQPGGEQPADNQPGGTEEIADEESPAADTPDEYVDLDDQDTALVDTIPGSDDAGGNNSTVYVVSGIGILAVIIAAVAILLRRKKS